MNMFIHRHVRRPGADTPTDSDTGTFHIASRCTREMSGLHMAMRHAHQADIHVDEHGMSTVQKRNPLKQLSFVRMKQREGVVSWR